MTIGRALAEGAARLAAAGVPEAGRDARRLMAAALGIEPARLVLAAGDPVETTVAARFAAMVDQRAQFRPVAQIVGVRGFWGRDFAVTGAVLDPRPETETLVALALKGGAARRLLDLGVGSGAILLTLLAEWPDAEGVGTDFDAAALAVAVKNAARLGVAGRADLQRTDWADGVAGPFDLVVSNPPYIAEGEMAGLSRDVLDWEPRGALTAGVSGLEAYEQIAGCLPGLMAPGGRVLLEIGPTQGAAVAAMLAMAGVEAVRVHPDFDGRDRVVAGRAPG